MTVGDSDQDWAVQVRMTINVVIYYMDPDSICHGPDQEMVQKDDGGYKIKNNK